MEARILSSLFPWANNTVAGRPKKGAREQISKAEVIDIKETRGATRRSKQYDDPTKGNFFSPSFPVFLSRETLVQRTVKEDEN